MNKKKIRLTLLGVILIILCIVYMGVLYIVKNNSDFKALFNSESSLKFSIKELNGNIYLYKGDICYGKFRDNLSAREFEEKIKDIGSYSKFKNTKLNDFKLKEGKKDLTWAKNGLYKDSDYNCSTFAKDIIIYLDYIYADLSEIYLPQAEAELVRELDSIIKKHDIGKVIGLDTAVDVIINNIENIELACQKYDVSFEVMASILFREMIFYHWSDELYDYERERFAQNDLGKRIIKAISYNLPVLNRIKNEPTIGIAQIGVRRVKNAYNAYKHLLEYEGENIDIPRESEILAKLRTIEGSIETLAFILRYEVAYDAGLISQIDNNGKIVEKNNMKKAPKDLILRVFEKYNATPGRAKQYAEETILYYDKFKAFYESIQK